MIAKGLTIPTTFTAIDGTKQGVKSMIGGLRGFKHELETVSARSERTFRRLTPSLGNATKQLLSYASAGSALAGIGYSVKSIVDYESAIASLQAVTGVSDEQLVGFKYEIEDLAKTSKKSSIDVAKSFETIGSNMSEYLNDPKGLRQIAEAGILLSKAARTELEPTLNDLTSIMNQFNIKAGEAAKTVDTLTAGEIVGSVRTSQLSGYLQQFGGVASSNNVKLSESVALVEALGKQLPKEAIGTAARNLITFMSAAKGMDKKALHSLHQYGVNLDVLMDKNTALGVKIKELSKIRGDAVAMERFFGRENIAAGSVIFQQLETYNQYEKTIRSTSQTQLQAAKNSSTLQAKLGMLRDKWITLITTSDGATGGLEKVKSVIGFLTDHMETLISIVTPVIGLFAAWKAINVALAFSIKGLSIWQGIQSAVTGYSTYAIEANTVAMRAQGISLGIIQTATEAWSIVTALATGNMAALNVVLIANPIGAVITGVLLLTAALGGLAYMHSKLRDEYEKELSMRVQQSYEQEATTIENLAQKYIKLGLSKEEALKKSIRFERESIGLSQLRNRAEIETLNNDLRAHQITTQGFLTGGAKTTVDLPGSDAIRDQILAKRKIGTELAAQSLGLTNYAISKTTQDEKAKSKMDLGNTQLSASETANLLMPSKEFVNPAITNAANSNITVTVQNNSENQAEMQTAGKTRSIMPATSSTMTVNKR